jgi:NhaP-type Na+/H+ or K+/H+ antiporter
VTATIVVSVLLFSFALVSRRLRTTPVTGAMIFVAAGLLMGPDALDVIHGGFALERFRWVLEAALVLVLFADAAAIASWDWQHDNGLPLRLLGIGLPLSIALGWGVALLLIPGIGMWEAALIGAILAPTDAALGQAVISNVRVPERIRQTLNVESGLNDGLALPFVTVFIALILEYETSTPAFSIARVISLSIVVSPLIGAAVGWLGARGLGWARERGWTSKEWTEIGVIALAFGSYAMAVQVDGSGFIAAWVAGYAAGRVTRGREEPKALDLAEDLGGLLSTVGFFSFGLVIGPQLGDLSLAPIVFAILALTVVRIVPVGISLLGTGLAAPTLLYVGWFGPRGLASMVFTLLALEAGVGAGSGFVLAASITVLLSVYAHGATAVWGSSRYADWFGRASAHTPQMPEAGEIAGPSVRRRFAAPGPDRT